MRSFSLSLTLVLVVSELMLLAWNRRDARVPEEEGKEDVVKDRIECCFLLAHSLVDLHEFFNEILRFI